jgi:hypothetical protein
MYQNMSFEILPKQKAQSLALRSGVHCIRQYTAGKDLTSKREVMNLLELFAADWAVLLISVNNNCLVELESMLVLNLCELSTVFQL